MSYEQYWCGDPYLTRLYLKAFELKREERNQELWMQGLYISNALDVTIYNYFAKQKSAKPAKYMEKPLRITPETEEEKKQRAEAERQKIIDSLTKWKERWDNGRQQSTNHSNL